ncbi:MAG: sigma-54-dependent Fis family transcriptional regulator [Elusimicrobia bacterium]|nr:sigma-54-dependent Fis family transcriptional regulator [Elusimicrobiota bacterium]
MDEKRILLVEDDPAQAALFSLELKRRGFLVESETRAAAAAARVEKEIFDAVVTDLRLGAGDGLQVLAAARASQPETGVIVITGHGSIDTAVAAMKAGAFDYLTKPVEPEELALALRKSIEHRDLLGEVRRLRAELKEGLGFSRIVSASAAMRRVLALVAKVAATDATVLVTGESGTGKELVARAIHENSPRRDGSFVALNCGALPEGLLESELFGHVKGSFTGADRNKRGLFEEASGGTLFLDEVTETTPGLQVKLLRALQEGEIRRVGDNHPIKVSARVVAASNRDLRKLVAEGKFREDLYYRLKVFPIEIPPLRERIEDVLPLAESFLKKARVRTGSPGSQFSPDAVRALGAYAWPGNVRELEHAVERALIMAAGPQIEAGDLPPEIAAGVSPAPARKPRRKR